MQGIKKYFFSLVVMGFFSIGMLLFLSGLTYWFKWTADEVLVGITFTYIAAGFIGGKIKKSMSYETNMLKKLLEGFWLGTFFMIALVVIAILVGNELAADSRFFMIWMLLIGSASLGRIL